MHIYTLNNDANPITFNTAYNSRLLLEYTFLITNKNMHQV